MTLWCSTFYVGVGRVITILGGGIEGKIRHRIKNT